MYAPLKHCLTGAFKEGGNYSITAYFALHPSIHQFSLSFYKVQNPTQCGDACEDRHLNGKSLNISHYDYI